MSIIRNIFKLFLDRIRNILIIIGCKILKKLCGGDKEVLYLILQKLSQNRRDDVIYKAVDKMNLDKDKLLHHSLNHFTISEQNIVLGLLQGYIPLHIHKTNMLYWDKPQPQRILVIKETADLGIFDKSIDKNNFEVKINCKFSEILENTSITGTIEKHPCNNKDFIDSLIKLYERGNMQSIEVYQDENLVGGLIGFSLNHYYCILYSFETTENSIMNAYKYLMQKLIADKFQLLVCNEFSEWMEPFSLKMFPELKLQHLLINAITSPSIITKNT
jgi:leucyl/phenylalanyl-tRNA---protein transferase